MTARRNDDEWVHDLASEDTALRDDAISDLRDMLCRGLSKSLSQSGRVDGAFLEDIVQETCIRILEKLNTFVGRSKLSARAASRGTSTSTSSAMKQISASRSCACARTPRK